MSRRIALICKGRSKDIDFVDKSCGRGELYSLDNNVNEVERVLKEYGEWDTHIYEVVNYSKLKEKLDKIIDNGFDELLFYYTGHGEGSDEQYSIVGTDECDIPLMTLLKQREILGKSVSVILDACESASLIKYWDDNNNYEILTAASASGKAYEPKIDDEDDRDAYKATSYFSNKFCTFIETSVFKNREDITLKDFNKHLIDEYDKIPVDKKQLSNYHEPTNNLYTKINLIAYSRFHDSTKQTLQTYYSDLADLKKKALDYIHSEDSIFVTIKEVNNWHRLFSILMKDENRKILYCIFKELDIAIPEERNEFRDVDCISLKKRSEESRSVTKVILRIEPINNRLDDCVVSGWLWLDANRSRPKRKGVRT